MPLNRPPAEQIFAIVAQATPLLKQLEAARATAESYAETAAQYQELAIKAQEDAAAIQTQLGVYSDQIAELYNIHNPPVPTPNPTPEEDEVV
jgi:hypothetical protein